MTTKDYSQLQKNLLMMIQYFRKRDTLSSTIREWLKPAMELTVNSKKWKENILNLEKSTINESNLSHACNILRTKAENTMLYSNKLIKIWQVEETTFDQLYNHFNTITTAKITDYNDYQLISDQVKIDPFRHHINKKLIGFYQKDITKDKAKFDLYDRVEAELQDEFSQIIGLKDDVFTAINGYIFDIENKVIIVGLDLSEIVKHTIMEVNFANFNVELKSKVGGISFPNTSINFFPKIDSFYNNKSKGNALELALRTPDGVNHSADTSKGYKDARKSDYHKEGVKGVNGKITLYRIRMEYDTMRKTSYIISLKSTANMAKKPIPTLYQATIIAQNSNDFANAIDKLL